MHPVGGRKVKVMQQDQDIGTILICALRYCMGRKTYMPSLVIDWAKRHWDEIHRNDQKTIYRDLDKAIKSGQNMGHECDVQDWMDFREWLAMKEYQIGDMSIGKLAEILGISFEESKEILRQAGIPLDLGVDSVEELLLDTKNA